MISLVRHITGLLNAAYPEDEARALAWWILEETTGFLCVIHNNIKLSRRNGWAILPDNSSTYIFVLQNAFWKAYMTVEMNATQVGNDIQVGYNLKELPGTPGLQVLRKT